MTSKPLFMSSKFFTFVTIFYLLKYVSVEVAKCFIKLSFYVCKIPFTVWSVQHWPCSRPCSLFVTPNRAQSRLSTGERFLHVLHLKSTGSSSFLTSFANLTGPLESSSLAGGNARTDNSNKNNLDNWSIRIIE